MGLLETKGVMYMGKLMAAGSVAQLMIGEIEGEKDSAKKQEIYNHIAEFLNKCVEEEKIARRAADRYITWAKDALNK